MTFKDLQKLVQSQSGPESSQLLQRLRDKPFWIWDQSKHKQRDISTKGACCFNPIVGLPRKDGIEKPLFDYEWSLYRALLEKGYLNSNPKFHSDDPNNIAYTFKEKHLWVKKATGLGVTEFFLRFMAWLCLKDNSYRNSQMCIVTGPNQELAIKLIKRMKGLFEEKLAITFDSKETVCQCLPNDKLPSEYEKCLTGINCILKEAWDTSRDTKDKREKMQALSLAKECYSMKLDLLTNVGVIREAMKFVADKKKVLYQDDNKMNREESPKVEEEPLNLNKEPEQ